MPPISPSALHQLQRLYQKSGTVDTEEDETSESVEIDSNETVVVSKVAMTEQSLSHHLPPAAISILRGNNSQQPHRSKDKIDSITRDLSNVDLD